MLIYRILSIALFPFIEIYLFIRVAKKKEDKKRLKERFGQSSLTRPQGQVIWIHAVSVGEANSALTLLEELLSFYPSSSILLTTTTLTSAAIVASKLREFNGRVIHQFLPIDSYFCVKNFLNFWHPQMVIFVESEIWPNLIFEARQMGVPTFLVNARMSEKSFSKWLLAKKFGFEIFDNFTAIFVQSEDDKKRFSQLSNQEILFYGNLKSQAQNLGFDAEKLEKLKSQIGERRFWIAASTHKGEEEIALQVHQSLKKEFPDLLTIIIPRHPNRAEEIKILLNGINFSQRSKGEAITNLSEIYLADSLSELGIFYRLAKFTFVGGSLTEVGGHNPFEAIKLGCAVISGRFLFNFKEIYRELEVANACVIVESVKELAVAVERFLKDKKFCQDMSSKAAEVIKNSENIAQKIVARISNDGSGFNKIRYKKVKPAPKAAPRPLA